MDNYNYIVPSVSNLCEGQEQAYCNRPELLSFDNNITVNLSFSLLRTLVRLFISMQIVVLIFSCRRGKSALYRCMLKVVCPDMFQTLMATMQHVFVIPVVTMT